MARNPANAAMPYLNQIPGQALPYLQPYAQAGQAALPYMQNYMQAGQSALPYMQQHYGELMEHPGQMLNSIGANYQQSPGLNFAIQKALDASGHAAAAGGMAGSPQHQEQNMGLATSYANQDYNNYMNHALGLYGAGLSGGQGLVTGGQDTARGLYSSGQQASQSMSDMIAQKLAQQGNLAFNGQAQQNMNRNNSRNALWGNAFKGLGFAGSLGAFGPLSFLNGGMSSDMYGGS